MGFEIAPSRKSVERRNEVLEMGHSETLGPDQLSVLDDCNGNSRHAIRGHETPFCFFDLRALFGGKILALGWQCRRAEEKDQQQERKRAGGPACVRKTSDANRFHVKHLA
jgi:hypothetical protein